MSARDGVDPEAPWPFQHTMEELEVMWDAFMEATITEGHPLHYAVLTIGRDPYLLSHVFDLVLTASEKAKA